ncbi:MAG: helix-turn-helix transcriptional regulator, partial [Streptosporangiaceae bacterium]
MPIVRDPLNPKLSLWHWLAFQLRYLREANGLSLTQAGAVIHAARSTVSNIEAGRLRIDDDQARLLDLRYGTGHLLQLLLYFARIGHDPEWFRTFSKYESEATVIKVYAGSVIPIPLQTERYIRGLLAESRVEDVDAATASRMARQHALLNRDDPPWTWFLLDEAALRIAVGGGETMREQLVHLRQLAELPRVSV